MGGGALGTGFAPLSLGSSPESETVIIMNLSRISLLALTAALGAASMANNNLPVNQILTATQGDELSLVSLTMTGTGVVFTEEDFQRWEDARLATGGKTYGWIDPIKRDMNTSGNKYAVNPDRRDNAKPMAGESSSTGTLREVFTARPLDYILDSEDCASWSLDLKLGNGQYIKSDKNSKTPEIAILERGMNSDLKVKAIVSNGGQITTTKSVFLSRTAQRYTNFKMDTLEIAGAQKVGVWGLSLDSFGPIEGQVIGLQISSDASYGGPDLVGVATNAVPEPGTMIALGAGLAALARRRRKTA